MHWTEVASNFFQFTFGTYAQTTEPNVWRLSIDGFFLDHTLNGVWSFRGEEGLRFDR